MEKQELRQEIRRRKAQCSPEERARLSERLCREVLEHPQWKQARTVLLYHALPDEVDTTLLFYHALPDEMDTMLLDSEARRKSKDEQTKWQVAGARRILLPVVVGDDLELREYTGHTRTGAFHIEEPVGERFDDYASIDLVVVPGLAFDPQGHRLGRGRGYYDRLLPRLSRAFRLGLCFPFQFVSHIPVEPHDITMHEVISAG